MIDQIVFWGLCAVLVFLPLPIGAVEEWAIFAFEAATVGLYLLHIGGRTFARRRNRGRPGPEGPAGSISPEAWGLAPSPNNGNGGRLGPGRLPRLVKVLLGVFAAFSILQIVPLPAGFVEVLSPRAYALYAGLVRDGIAAPSPWLTLSLTPSATISELILLSCYALFGYLVLRTVRSRRQVEILVAVTLASALFQSLFGMAEVFSGHEHLLGRPKRYGVGSVTGTFVNRNHLAGFLEMAFPLSLGFLLVKARYFAMEKGLSLRRKIVWFGQESLQWTLLLGLVPVFIALSQRRPSESLRGGADGRSADSAPCRSPPPATGIFEATSLSASRGSAGRWENIIFVFAVTAPRARARRTPARTRRNPPNRRS